MRIVLLEKPAYHVINDAVLNGYKKEVIGYLVGERKRDYWLVQEAFLGTIGGFNSAGFNRKERHEQNSLEERLVAQRLFRIGDFHSHTDSYNSLASAELSPKDLTSMKQFKDGIHFLVSIARNKSNLDFDDASDGFRYYKLCKKHLMLQAFGLSRNKRGYQSYPLELV